MCIVAFTFAYTILKTFKIAEPLLTLLLVIITVFPLFYTVMANLGMINLVGPLSLAFAYYNFRYVGCVRSDAALYSFPKSQVRIAWLSINFFLVRIVVCQKVQDVGNGRDSWICIRCGTPVNIILGSEFTRMWNWVEYCIVLIYAVLIERF